MHTYDDTEAYVSLVRTFPDLSGWTLDNLLGQYADLAALQKEAVQVDAPELGQIETDMAAIADELKRRTTPAEALDEAYERGLQEGHELGRKLGRREGRIEACRALGEALVDVIADDGMTPAAAGRLVGAMAGTDQ